MPRNVRVYTVGAFQNKRVCKTLLVRPVLSVRGRAQLDKRDLTLPAVAAVVGVGIVRPHQPVISTTPDNGGRLHIIAILTVDQAFIRIAARCAGDLKAVVFLLHTDKPQVGGSSRRLIPLPDVIHPKLIGIRVIYKIGVTIVRAGRLMLHIAQRVFNAVRHDPVDAVVGGGKAWVFVL